MTDFAELVGETITGIHGMSKSSDHITFMTKSGREFEMYHDQDCCEHVAVEDVVGRVQDLFDSPILKAEETSNIDDPVPGKYQPASYTWTFYTLATVKGYVTLRWLGESNGYYSESVEFEEVE